MKPLASLRGVGQESACVELPGRARRVAQQLNRDSGGAWITVAGGGGWPQLGVRRCTPPCARTARPDSRRCQADQLSPLRRKSLYLGAREEVVAVFPLNVPRFH